MPKIPYTYTVKRSRRRSIALEILPDTTVLVRAPQHMPQRDIDAFVLAHTAWVERHLPEVRERQAARTALSDADVEALRSAARAVIPERVAYFSARMGLVPTTVKITAARTRFGSCSGKNALCFSLYLMQYPPEAVDYVVVHELAHIRQHNHSAAFYALVAQIMPDYPARQALLRRAPRKPVD